MSEPVKISCVWLRNTPLEIAAMNALSEVMEHLRYESEHVDDVSEMRIAQWFYSKYGGTK